MEIRTLFEAEANPVLKIFLSPTGGYKVPLYQRQYRWSADAITRLICSISEGICNLESNKNSITFIGTVICAKEQPKELGVTEVYAVVDGQQRLTTLTLISCLLHQRISTKFAEISDQSVSKALHDYFERSFGNQLMSTVAGRYDEWGESGPDNHFPKIIREKLDDWSMDAHEYRSPVAAYIFKYIQHIYQDKKQNKITAYVAEKEAKGEEPGNYFFSNIDTILKNLDQIGRGLAGEEGDLESINFPTIGDIFQKNNFSTVLVPGIGLSFKDLKPKLTDPKLVETLYLISFANFLLNRVALTRVVATEERYAFDIFESLNTTGEPLTAIETLKPFVVVVEDDKNPKGGGYFSSDAYHHFHEIERYLDSKIDGKENFPESKDKQKESAEMAVTFALLYDGGKISYQLSPQRSYLQARYDNKKLSYDQKAAFIEKLGKVADFKSRFWLKPNLKKQLALSESGPLIRMCIDLMRSMGNTLSIPVMIRYSDSDSSQDQQDFCQAVKALTAFLVIWRGYYGTTASIDSKYRELMQNGCKTISGATPLCYGTSFNNEIPPVWVLKIYLRKFLEDKELLDKQTWTNQLKETQVYKHCRLVSKFMLLVAAHQAGLKTGSNFLLEKERSGTHKQYMNDNAWNSQDFQTIEHVAPQQPSDKNDWQESIYSESLVHTLGNLILLPERENKTVRNKSWKSKKRYYEAFSEDKHEKIEEFLEKAKEDGVDFGPKTARLLKEGGCLPTVTHIANVNEWTHDVIKQRSENIAGLVFDEITQWLD